MKKNIRTILGALALTVFNKNILLLFIVINIDHLLLITQAQEIYRAATFITGILAFISLPFLYAYFYEIVFEKERSSIDLIAKKYFFKFYLLTIIITIPLVLPLLLSFISESRIIVIISIVISLLVALATIYITPYFFMSTKILLSIKKGINFLFNHLKLSINIIVLTLILAAVQYYLEFHYYVPFIENSYLQPLGGFVLSISGAIITFSIFILASINIRTIEN